MINFFSLNNIPLCKQISKKNTSFQKETTEKIVSSASFKCIYFIKNFEGLRLHAYQDQGKLWTIGYGHTDNVKENDIINRKNAEVLLQTDIKIINQQLNHRLKQISITNPSITNLLQQQYDALTSFCFNIGVHGSFYNSNNIKTGMHKELLANNLSMIPNEINKWVYVKQKKNYGLIKRRQSEARLFQKGIYE